MSVMPTTIAQWLDGARAADVGALTALYDDEAVLEAFHEVVEGSEEIAQRLYAVRAKLRKLHIEDVQVSGDAQGALRFDTRVGGFLGLLHLRHEVRLTGGRILAHKIDVMAWDKSHTAAS